MVGHHWTYYGLGLTSTTNIGLTVSGIKDKRCVCIPKCACARYVSLWLYAGASGGSGTSDCIAALARSL